MSDTKIPSILRTMITEQIIRYVKLLILFIFIWFGIAFVNGIGCVNVESHEMEPTYEDGAPVWVSPKHTDPQLLVADDVVSYNFRTSKKKGQMRFAGRVIGLPGDRVKIVNGDVFVNGKQLSQTYVSKRNRSTDDYAEIIVPRDSVFVLADHRKGYKDVDSRGIGPVGRWAVVGRFESGFWSLFFQAMAFW